jgi:hypothetical protein
MGLKLIFCIENKGQKDPWGLGGHVDHVRRENLWMSHCISSTTRRYFQHQRVHFGFLAVSSAKSTKIFWNNILKKHCSEY